MKVRKLGTFKNPPSTANCNTIEGQWDGTLSFYRKTIIIGPSNPIAIMLTAQVTKELVSSHYYSAGESFSSSYILYVRGTLPSGNNCSTPLHYIMRNRSQPSLILFVFIFFFYYSRLSNSTISNSCQKLVSQEFVRIIKKRETENVSPDAFLFDRETLPVLIKSPECTSMRSSLYLLIYCYLVLHLGGHSNLRNCRYLGPLKCIIFL